MATKCRYCGKELKSRKAAYLYSETKIVKIRKKKNDDVKETEGDDKNVCVAETDTNDNPKKKSKEPKTREVIVRYYFCNEDHYQAWKEDHENELKRQAEFTYWRDKFNFYVEDMMGQPFAYSIFNTKLKPMLTTEGYKKMYSYITYNRDEIDNQLNQKDFSRGIYFKLAYLCAIILNNAPTWKEPEEKMKVDISSQFDYKDDNDNNIEIVSDSVKKILSNRRKNIRRSLAELEEEEDDDR